MTDTREPQADHDLVHTASSSSSYDPGLLSRLVGVLFSPRRTFSAVVQHPRSLGAMVAVVVVVGGSNGALLSTARGQQMMLEESIAGMESFGITVSDDMYAQISQGSDFAAYSTAAGAAVGFPVLVLALTAGVWMLGWVVFGAGAQFKVLYAVVTHVGAVSIVQQLFGVPLNYVRGAMNSPSTLAVFFPMLEEGTFTQRTLGLVDVFVIWQLFVLSTGVAVLYKRRTRPIATTFYLLYAVIAVGGGAGLSRIGG